MKLETLIHNVGTIVTDIAATGVSGIGKLGTQLASIGVNGAQNLAGDIANKGVDLASTLASGLPATSYELGRGLSLSGKEAVLRFKEQFKSENGQVIDDARVIKENLNRKLNELKVAYVKKVAEIKANKALKDAEKAAALTAAKQGAVNIANLLDEAADQAIHESAKRPAAKQPNVEKSELSTNPEEPPIEKSIGA